MSELRDSEEITKIIKLSKKFNHMECAAKMYDWWQHSKSLKAQVEILKKCVEQYADESEFYNNGFINKHGGDKARQTIKELDKDKSND